MKKLFTITFILLLLVGCNQKTTLEDYEAYYHPIFQTTEPISLYDSDHKIVGSIEAEQIVTLEDYSTNSYFKMQDLPYYIYYKDVGNPAETSNKISFDHYVPFNKGITTNSTFRLFTLDNQQIMTINEIFSFPTVIMMEEDYYTIQIMDTYYKIPVTDIDDVYDGQQNNQKLATEVPVLMYHFFYSKENGEKPHDNNWLEIHQFEKQLKYLTENNYHILTMSELEHFLKNEVQIPEKSVVITIDDGDPSVYQYAYPLLEKYQVHATTFLVTSWYWWDIDNRTREFIELQSHSHDMHRSGCKVQHGGKMLCIDFDEGVQDLKTSQEYLYDSFVFCYPFGDVNQHSKDMLLAAGYRMAFTTRPGKVKPGMDLLELPRVRISNELSLQQFINLLP